uniref:ShKT domain-containing protein n=1 Tax=Acrobeloides nanus TaxID=290746 RepID=A0A914CUM7_9BILA
MLKVLLLYIFVQFFVFETESALQGYPKFDKRYLAHKSRAVLSTLEEKLKPGEVKGSHARSAKDEAKLKGLKANNVESTTFASFPDTPTTYGWNQPTTITAGWWTLKTTTQSPNGQCKDSVNFCSQYLNSCHDPTYLPLLCVDCKASCGLCDDIGQAICSQYTATPTPTYGYCYDTSNDCSEYTNFCSSPAYRSQMCKYCQYSCGLCNDPSCSNESFKKIFKIK